MATRYYKRVKTVETDAGSATVTNYWSEETVWRAFGSRKIGRNRDGRDAWGNKVTVCGTELYHESLRFELVSMIDAFLSAKDWDGKNYGTLTFKLYKDHTNTKKLSRAEAEAIGLDKFIDVTPQQ